MKVSESWLREWVNPSATTDELVHLLTMAGLEVDGVETAAPAFSGVVVGRIDAVAPHPDADKLRVCEVFDGQSTTQVVCGAPNAAAGMLVPYAKPGAQLPGGLSIKTARLRGVESAGMLCGASELGLEDVVDGLLALPADTAVGSDLRAALQLDDAIIDVDLTPNRGDCLSLAGVAREVGVLTATDLTPPAIAAVEPAVTDAMALNLQAGDYCPRYSCRVLRNVDASRPSPAWLVQRLQRAGLRAIDPVVDVTNFVMLELGQPLHAFDLDKIDGDTVTVRRAQAGEKLLLLDQSESELDDSFLLIADDQKPLALAGIMGGDSSAVSSSTRNILLEAAFFTPSLLAGQARKLGMHTDASHRFERGVDPMLQARALERATALLLDIVGGEPGPVTTVEAEQLFAGGQVDLLESQIQRQLGFAIPPEQVEDIFTRLEFQPVRTATGWQITVPSHRFDIAIEADLLEELARIYGYDRLPVEMPDVKLQFGAATESQVGVGQLADSLVACGYQEVISYSFIDPAMQAMFFPGAEPLAVSNPISSDMAVMRGSLLPGLLHTAQYNLHRQQSRLKLFELGLGFAQCDGQLAQTPRIAGLLVGLRRPESWHSDSRDAFDFYDIKADVQKLIGQGEAVYAPIAEGDGLEAVFPCSALHPGQSAKVVRAGQCLGVLGQLHPVIAQKLDLGRDCWVFELQLSLISGKKVPEFKELSKFPDVRRDLSVIVDRKVNAGELAVCAEEAAGTMLVELVIFDQYSGDGVADGMQSVGLGLTWQHSERTLNEDEVNALSDQVLAALKQRFNASLR